MNLPTITGTPIGKRVLVFPDEKETKVGSIIIPEMAQKNARTGIIVQIGDECEKLKPYQPVLFGEYSGSTMTFEEGEFVLMYESDVQYAWPPLKEEDVQKRPDPDKESQPAVSKRKIRSTVLK